MSIDEATRRERGNRVVVSIRLEQDALAALDKRCAQLGVSRSEYVAEMLVVALPRRRRRQRS